MKECLGLLPAILILAGAFHVNGQGPPRPFSTASSLVVEQQTAKVALVEGKELHLVDPLKPGIRGAIAGVGEGAIVSEYRGAHIAVVVQAAGDSEFGQLVVFNENGAEKVRLPQGEGFLRYPGPAARLSVDGSLAWERLHLGGSKRSELGVPDSWPDGATVLAWVDIESGARIVKAISGLTETGSGAGRVSDVVLLAADDALVTVHDGTALRIKNDTIVWQRPTPPSRPWQLFDVDLQRSMALVGDDERGLRIVRLSDGKDIAAWQFAESPDNADRQFQELMGRGGWLHVKRALTDRFERERSIVSTPSGSQGDGDRERREKLFGIWSARFLPSGAIVASGYAQEWVVLLDPTRPGELLGELFTELATAGFETARSLLRAKGIHATVRQIRIGREWQLLVATDQGWIAVPHRSQAPR
jgi:hypothetical protein